MTSHPLAYYDKRPIEPLRPNNPFLSFYRQANRLFEDVFREFDEAREALSGAFAPHIDVTHSEHETRVTAQLPDVREDDVGVSIRHDVLTIRAQKYAENDQEQGKSPISERSFGTFERSFRLAQPVDPEHIHAHFDHGVLTVILPGIERQNGESQIAIHASAPPAIPTEAAAPKAHH